MIFIAILLGLGWHVFAGVVSMGALSTSALMESMWGPTSSAAVLHASNLEEGSRPSRGVWAAYLEPFRTWVWFQQCSEPAQMALIFLPPVLIFVVLWESGSNLLWGLGAFVVTVVSFALSCDGYRYVDGVCRFGDVSFSNLNMLEGANTPTQGASDRPSPHALYEWLFERPAPKRLPALRKAILTDGLVHTTLHLFVVLFWFVCLGPLAAVLIAIALAVLSADTVSQGLVRRVSSAMHWVAWVPTRLFSLTLFLVLREDKTPIRQWWVTVKLAEQGVPEVMLATLRLVWSQRAQPHDLRQPGSAAVVWPCEDFTSMHAALKKVLLLWLGGVALLSILFY